VTEAASDWIWEMDENLRFTYLSERFFALTGIAPQHVLGRARWELAGMDLTIDPQKWRNTGNPGKTSAFSRFCLPRQYRWPRGWIVTESQRQADL
jgi:PAS domain-containing protein